MNLQASFFKNCYCCKPEESPLQCTCPISSDFYALPWFFFNFHFKFVFLFCVVHVPGQPQVLPRMTSNALRAHTTKLPGRAFGQHWDNLEQQQHGLILLSPHGASCLIRFFTLRTKQIFNKFPLHYTTVHYPVSRAPSVSNIL